jgi:hypothetical protein
MSELCELCQSIQLRPPTLPSQPVNSRVGLYSQVLQNSSPQIHHHYPSFQLLQASANDGCPLCAFFHRTLSNADVLINIGNQNYGGIFLIWYRTSIEIESSICEGVRKETGPIQSTKKWPGVWDNLGIWVQNYARLSPAALNSFTPSGMIYGKVPS